jgi:hypothetical protein
MTCAESADPYDTTPSFKILDVQLLQQKVIRGAATLSPTDLELPHQDCPVMGDFYTLLVYLSEGVLSSAYTFPTFTHEGPGLMRVCFPTEQPLLRLPAMGEGTKLADAVLAVWGSESLSSMQQPRSPLPDGPGICEVEGVRLLVSQVHGIREMLCPLLSWYKALLCVSDATALDVSSVSALRPA